MAKKFAIDSTEFTVALGPDVNATPGRSLMSQPVLSTDLVIESIPGSGSPFTFALGDRYDLSFTYLGIDYQIDAAEIVRSDVVNPAINGGAVVFEAMVDGVPLHLLWSANVDLEQWFQNNGGAGAGLDFYNTDRSFTTYQFVCFAAGTLIATPRGQVPVERLRPGHRVRTLDNGAGEILWAGSKTQPGTGAAAPVVFRPGAIGNDRTLALSPQHRVLLTSPLAELWHGTPEVWAPAKALADGARIRFAPRDRITYHHLLLAEHQVIFANGAPTESLYLGDVARGLLGARQAAEIARLAPAAGLHHPPDQAQGCRPIVSVREAQALARCLGTPGNGSDGSATGRAAATLAA